MKLVVQKYGGSSVADTGKIFNVAAKINRRINEGFKLIVVISAMGKSTDALITQARKISEHPDPRELDMLLSTGEQVSASLLSMALIEQGIKSKSLNAFQAGIRTTEEFNEAKILSFNNNKLFKLLEEHDVIVITGFQGITEGGDLTTLGRGGSDTSAVALAASLKAECEIYSDVAGIFTIDPKLHPAAKKLKYVAYEEMLEMASLGAKVLHSRSVEIAKKFSVKIYCASTFSSEEGSYVVDENIIIEQVDVTGCSITENEIQVFIKKLPLNYSLIKDLFTRVAEEGLNVDMISIINTDSNLVVSFTIVESKKQQFEEMFDKVFSDYTDHEIEYHSGVIKLSVVGIGMRSGIGVASRFFKAFESIPIYMVTTSDIKISCLFEEKYKETAIEAVTKEFNL